MQFCHLLTVDLTDALKYSLIYNSGLKYIKWEIFPLRQLPTSSIPTLSIPTLSTLTKWELTKWELTKWEVDQMGIDEVGIDKVGIDEVGISRGEKYGYLFSGYYSPNKPLPV